MIRNQERHNLSLVATLALMGTTLGCSGQALRSSSSHGEDGRETTLDAFFGHPGWLLSRVAAARTVGGRHRGVYRPARTSGQGHGRPNQEPTLTSAIRSITDIGTEPGNRGQSVDTFFALPVRIASER